MNILNKSSFLSYFTLFLNFAMACIANWNVNGLRDPRRCDTIFQHLFSKNFDIILLQETHLNSAEVDKTFANWKGKSFHSVSTDNRKGVSILISDKINTTIHSHHACNTGHYVILDLSIDDNRFILVNIYAPTGGKDGIAGRKQFLQNLQKDLDKYPRIFPFIVGGDFNCVLNNDLDRSCNVAYVDQTVLYLKSFLTHFNLEDIWRTQNPTKKEFTYLSPLGSFSRLDKFYTSREFRDKFTNCFINSFPHSDHDKVILKLDFSKIKRGPGSWMLNSSILKDKLLLISSMTS